MLTVDFDRWGVRRGESLLDLGCGQGRHSYEALKRGLDVVSVDIDQRIPADVQSLARLVAKEEGDTSGRCDGVRADALALPFSDASFDRVVAAEVLEHISDDQQALAEIARVLKPGGSLAVTVPRYWPERVCWALSEEYHSKPGGHVRIYRRGDLLQRLRRSGLVTGAEHFAHALHSPYWWMKCLIGPDNDDALVVRLYHRFLVWDITAGPRSTRTLERMLNPIAGKSFVVYAEKPGESVVAA